MLLKKKKKGIEWNQRGLLRDDRQAWEGKMVNVPLQRFPGLKRRKLVGWTFEGGQCEFEQREDHHCGEREKKGNLMIAKDGEERAASI